MSSTKNVESVAIELQDTLKGKLLITTQNNNGPRTDLWGTPLFTTATSESLLWYKTL
jgi:hypothetical protein